MTVSEWDKDEDESVEKTKLILFEGIPGSGKTTTAQLLFNHLINDGLDAKVYIEGSKHPIDLPFFAYLTDDEYHDVLCKFPEQAEWITVNSIIELDYVLIPYKEPVPKPWNDELIEYLKSKEFCYSDKPIVPFEMFKKVFYRRFERYVASMNHTNTVTIFESVLFQHQIHDINRLYPEISETEIIEYLGALAKLISPLKPVLFYMTQDRVKESLEHTAVIRSKPKWSSRKTIEYYIKRKHIELEAVKHMPFNTYILNNSDRDWEKMFDLIKTALSLE